MSKRMLTLDFDGVIHSYLSGWKGAGEIPDAPVDGVAEALKTLATGYNLEIFSTRASNIDGRNSILQWLKQQALPQLRPTNVKGPAWLHVDDRVIPFRGSWPLAIDCIRTFVPWTKSFNERGQPTPGALSHRIRMAINEIETLNPHDQQFDKRDSRDYEDILCRLSDLLDELEEIHREVENLAPRG